MARVNVGSHERSARLYTKNFLRLPADESNACRISQLEEHLDDESRGRKWNGKNVIVGCLRRIGGDVDDLPAPGAGSTSLVECGTPRENGLQKRLMARSSEEPESALMGNILELHVFERQLVLKRPEKDAVTLRAKNAEKIVTAVVDAEVGEERAARSQEARGVALAGR